MKEIRVKNVSPWGVLKYSALGLIFICSGLGLLIGNIVGDIVRIEVGWSGIKYGFLCAIIIEILIQIFVLLGNLMIGLKGGICLKIEEDEK